MVKGNPPVGEVRWLLSDYHHPPSTAKPAMWVIGLFLALLTGGATSSGIGALLPFSKSEFWCGLFGLIGSAAAYVFIFRPTLSPGLEKEARITAAGVSWEYGSEFFIPREAIVGYRLGPELESQHPRIALTIVLENEMESLPIYLDSPQRVGDIREIMSSLQIAEQPLDPDRQFEQLTLFMYELTEEPPLTKEKRRLSHAAIVPQRTETGDWLLFDFANGNRVVFSAADAVWRMHDARGAVVAEGHPEDILDAVAELPRTPPSKRLIQQLAEHVDIEAVAAQWRRIAECSEDDAMLADEPPPPAPSQQTLAEFLATELADEFRGELTSVDLKIDWADEAGFHLLGELHDSRSLFYIDADIHWDDIEHCFYGEVEAETPERQWEREAHRQKSVREAGFAFITAVVHQRDVLVIRGRRRGLLELARGIEQAATSFHSQPPYARPQSAHVGSAGTFLKVVDDFGLHIWPTGFSGRRERLIELAEAISEAVAMTEDNASAELRASQFEAEGLDLLLVVRDDEFDPGEPFDLPDDGDSP